MKAHEGEPRYGDRDRVVAFEVRADGREHCNYCGSLSIVEAIKLLKTPGTKFSGSDWKYGWPHKFYIEAQPMHGAGKFYAIHLKDATDAELAEFDALSRSCFGVQWARDENGLKYGAPRSNEFGGFQLWGVIDANGKPDHSAMKPVAMCDGQHDAPACGPACMSVTQFT